MDILKERKTIIGIGLILAFIFLILTISTYYSYQHDIKQQERLDPKNLENMTINEIQQYIEEKRTEEITLKAYYLLPFSAFLGLIVGIIVFYIMSDKIIEQKNIAKKNTKIILKFLNHNERKIIETLLENEGRLRQYEISHIHGLNKVQTHRIIQSLEEKGIIEKEKLGKINNIKLNKELYEVLKE